MVEQSKHLYGGGSVTRLIWDDAEQRQVPHHWSEIAHQWLPMRGKAAGGKGGKSRNSEWSSSGAGSSRGRGSDFRPCQSRAEFPLEEASGSTRKRTHDGDEGGAGRGSRGYDGAQVICYHCKRPGHRMKWCWDLHGYPSSKGSGKFARWEADHSEDNEPDDPGDCQEVEEPASEQAPECQPVLN